MIGGPNLRRALHQCVDILLDALEDDAKGEKPKRTRNVREPVLPKIELTEEERERARKSWEKAGWREAG